MSPEEDALSLAQRRDDALERGTEDAWTAAEASLRAGGGSWLRRRHPHTPGTGRLLGVHEGAVTAVVLSADGKLAISGSEDGVGKVWSLAAGSLLAELRGHEGAIRDIALTPDGALAITASDDGTLRVWELPGGAERSTLEWHFAGVYSVTVSADARTAESRSHDEHVVVWDLGTGQPLRAAAMSGGSPARAPASAGDVTVIPSASHELLVHDAGGHVVRALAGHTGRILCTALHEDGRRLVSGGADWTVRAWDTARGALRVPGTDLSAATLTGNGRLAIAAGADGTLSVWDTATGRLRETRSRIAAPGSSFALSPLPGQAVLVAGEAALETWTFGEPTAAPAGGPDLHIPSSTGRVIAAAAAPDGQRAVTLAIESGTGQPQAHLRFWDLASGALLHAKECEPQAQGVTFLDSEYVLIAEPRAGVVRRLRHATGEATHTFRDLGPLTGALVAAPEAGWLFCAVSGGVTVADAATGKPLQNIAAPLSGPHPSKAARCLSVTPDGRFLALIGVAGKGPELVVHDVPGRRVVGRLALAFEPVSCSLSPDGATVFLGANIPSRRQVPKGRHDGGAGGWFEDRTENQPHVCFIDVLR